jgi:hypothetical protein
MRKVIAIADPDAAAPRRAPARLAKAVEKGLVDIAGAPRGVEVT